MNDQAVLEVLNLLPKEEVNNIEVAVQLLITGFVVVFAVLVILIGVIKLYSTIVYNIQNKKKVEVQNVVEEKMENLAPVVQETLEKQEDGSIPQEVIAVISAAVASMYGESNVKIKDIKKVASTRPVWSTAGLMENTRPF